MSRSDHNLNLPAGENLAPTPEKIEAMAQLLRAEPFHLGVPSHDRQKWDAWREHPIGRHWIEEARALAAQDSPQITNDLIALSLKQDSRATYTETNKKVREHLLALTMAECIEPTGEYIAQIEETIRDFVPLATWVHPAHDICGENFRGETIEIDLGSAQWALFFTAVDYLLSDRLSAETRALIRSEIEKRIFAPFRQRIETGQDIYWWITCTHNWNTVCLNCILSCALYLKKDHAERAWYLTVVNDLIKYSHEGFTESGFYTEGMSYWAYGFGNYVAFSELVKAATDGQIDWLAKPLQSRMALYGVRMELQEGLYPTFADSLLEYEPVSWVTHWMNNRLDDAPGRERATQEEINPFGQLDKQTITSHLLNMFHTVDGQKAYKMNYDFPCREWFDDVQFLICRPREDAQVKFAATFKGGHNGINHNHNDLGTFSVAIGHKYLICDPGLEIYTDRTFSRQRYQSDLLNSFGHPVPVVAGALQAPGKDEHRSGYGDHAYATVVETSFSDDRDRVTLDLTKAYEVESLISLQRTFIFDRANQGQVEVTDEVKFSQPKSFETALITYADWLLNEDGSLTISDGDAAIDVVVSCNESDVEFSHCVIQESTTPARLAWKLKEPVTHARVTISVRPL